jgi:molybdenum cofactor cytidylyltransferase
MPFTPGIVLLAAGRSRRMGRQKLLLPWGKTSVLGHLVRQWQALGVAQIAVVFAHGDVAVQAQLDRLGFAAGDRIVNPAPERGKISSIRCAAQWAGWNEELTHLGIVLGDQPHLAAETLRRLIEFSAAHPQKICVPRQGGHRRHPVLLPKTVFLELANSSATSLKQFLDHPPVEVEFCEIDDPALELDIDRPDDYEKAIRIFLCEN